MAFDNEYYHASSNQQWMHLDLAASAAGNIPEELEDQDCTLSMVFKNEAGQTVHSMSDIEVEDLYLKIVNWNEESPVYGADIYFNLNLVGFDTGSYTVDVTLNSESGKAYKLGETVLNVTDKTIIDDISILNYGSELTQSTKNFYVEIDTTNIFLDYDKLSVNLLDEKGQVVAKTVSKELRDTSSYNGSSLLYKLNVTQALEDTSYRNGYTLQILSEDDVELITSVSNVYVSVTTSPKIIRSEFIEPNIVKVYTENLQPGQYIIESRYSGDDDTVYEVTFDEQGVGTFQPEINSNYFYFQLKTLDGDYIRSFDVNIHTSYDYFSSSPSFFTVNTKKIDNFYVRTLAYEAVDSIADKIEYAHVTQNGEVVAKMSNLKSGSWSWSSNDSGYRYGVNGTLSVEDGKSFVKGDATIEIKYKDGNIYTHSIAVTDENTGLYGYIDVDNSGNLYTNIGDYWCSNAVTTDTVSFTIDKTNVTSGSVTLYSDNNKEALETLSLADLTKTDSDTGVYTYKGTFNTKIESGKVYEIYFNANDEQLSFDTFTYYTGKVAELSNDLTAYNGTYDICPYNMLNISNPESLTFKAVSNGKTYIIPVTKKYSGDNYIDFVADFSAVPAGYFTLKAFDGQTEVKLIDNRMGYNFGNVAKAITSGAGYYGKSFSFAVFGANLDKVEKAEAKIYQMVDFPESNQYYDKTKLKYVKDITLTKPYNATYIAVNNELISDLETGNYMLVYVLDGKPVETQEVFIKGSAPVYKASAVLNGGIEYTNKDSVALAVTATGYTKMRIAFSEADLETAQYEAISASKNISLDGKNGLVNIYVQFANADESKTETVKASVTIDKEAPVLDGVTLSDLHMWQNSTISFTSNELLRNAFITLGNVNEETGKVEGKNYVFSYNKAEDGKYVYICTIYAGSSFEDKTSLKAQIAAYDKAGNETLTAVSDINIAQPKNISGKVTNENGNAISYTSVYLYDENNNFVQYTYTDENGNYTFYDVYDGNYTIEVSHRMYKDAELAVNEDEFTSDITGKDITMESAYPNSSTVTVSVKNYSDEAVENAYVSIYSWETDTYLEGKTAADGTVAFTVPYDDNGSYYSVYTNYNADAELDKYGRYSNWKDLTVKSATETVEFAVPEKATITGVVLNGEEKVADVEVMITGKNYTTYAVTDENGAFSADVYIVDSEKTFTVSTYGDFNSIYSGTETVVFEDSLTANVELKITSNISVQGTIKDNMAQPVKTTYSSVYFYGNNVSIDVTIDDNGEFKTPAVFGVGTYTVSAYVGWPYETVEQTFEITKDDLASEIKELNLTAEKYTSNALFTSSDNKITASADVIAKGDVVTVNIKYKNDGIKTLSNVEVYADIPENAEVKQAETNGTVSTDGRSVNKLVQSLKADESGNLSFTIHTDNYNEKSLIIPAYVKVGNELYPIGAVTVEIAAVTLSAPQVVKTNTAFKVSGEAISGSKVEIMNYATKEVLATTTLTSKWYFADISGISEDTTLIAKVTTDGKTAYSDPVTVTVEDAPIAVNKVKIRWSYSLNEYGINKNYGYPTLSIWEGYNFNVSASFDNMPEGATVTYSFSNIENVPASKDGEYYSADIRGWSGYGTKKVYATVKTADNKEYKFIVTELIILVDPSGVITDSETGKPIEGAKVLLQVKSGNDWIEWDAQTYLQTNPMYSDNDGKYGWMVPEGEYRIIVTADGYETKIVEEYDSSDWGYGKITVLPPRTDVDIQLVYARAIELNQSSTKSVAGGKIKFVFTRPVDPSTFTADNFKIIDADGNAVAGSIVLAENNTVALFKPTAAMTDNSAYKLSIKDIKDNAGNTIAAEDIPFTKTANAAALADPAIVYNTTDGTVTITFADGKIPVNTEEIKVTCDNTAVSGIIRKNDNVITFIPDSAFAAGKTYKVTVSDSIRTDADEYLAAPVEKDITMPGGSTPGGGSSSGGGGGSSVSVAKPTASVAAGEVEKGTKVTLSTTTADAVIYYTLDGTTPTDKSSVYSEAIAINKAVILKAIAIKGTDKSSVLTVKYTIKKTADTPTAANPVFADIANYAWANEAITALTQKGIIKGVSATEYAPASDIKRADFMLLLVRMLDLKADVTSNFDDISADKYYYEGIGIAKALGLTSGVGDNKFDPEASITRQDMFVLAYRILKMQEIGLIDADESAISTFDDYAKIADYAKEALASLVKNDLVKGSYNMLNPVGNATRAETAVFIYSIYNLINN